MIVKVQSVMVANQIVPVRFLSGLIVEVDDEIDRIHGHIIQSGCDIPSLGKCLRRDEALNFAVVDSYRIFFDSCRGR